MDKQATQETKALYANLKKMSKTHIFFGHQDALAYGVKWSEWNKFRSDVGDVCGKHPAGYGWELSKLGKYNHNIDSVEQPLQKRVSKLFPMNAGGRINCFMPSKLTL